MTRLIKILLGILTALSVLIASAVVYLHYNKDSLIRLLLKEANHYIESPIHVKQIDLSLFESFPQLSLVFHEVEAKGSLSANQLLSARKLACSFDAYDLLHQQYTIRSLVLEEAQLAVVFDEQGKNNFSILKSRGEQSSSVDFNIEEILLRDVRIQYEDRKARHQYALHVKDSRALLAYRQETLRLKAEGRLISNYLKIGERIYLEQKPVEFESKLSYDFQTEESRIFPTRLSIKGADFILQGRYAAQSDEVDLTVNGRKSNLQTLWSLLPEEFSKPYEAFRSKGKAWFKAAIKGKLTPKQSPALKLAFGFQNASVFHPDLRGTITHLSFKGQYQARQLDDLKSAHLSLENIKGRMQASAFSGELQVQNFDDPYLKGTLQGAIQLENWSGWLVNESLKKIQGRAVLDLNFQGKLKDFKKRYASPTVRTFGQLELSNLSFGLKDWELNFRDFGGKLLFNNQDMVIDRFTGKAGNSHFEMKGYLKNVFAFLLQEEQAVEVEADLYAPLLDVDELLSANKSATTSQDPYYFAIDPRLKLKLNCRLDSCHFRRFRGQDLKMQLYVADQQAKAENLQVRMAGGELQMQARVDARKSGIVEVHSRSKIRNMQLDSLFYVFENFNQDFLKAQHLKGSLTASENSYLPFNRNLELDSKKLMSALRVEIRKGELNNFEPLKALRPYFKNDKLMHCYFSDVENSLMIEDRKLHISPMLVHTNLSSFELAGTHTFDQLMDYQLRIPLRSVSKNYQDNINTTGMDPNLFLTVKGSTDDFKVAYDTKAVRAKIRQDLRKERQELREAFRKQDKTVELGEEYFDF